MALRKHLLRLIMVAFMVSLFQLFALLGELDSRARSILSLNSEIGDGMSRLGPRDYILPGTIHDGDLNITARGATDVKADAGSLLRKNVTKDTTLNEYTKGLIDAQQADGESPNPDSYRGNNLTKHSNSGLKNASRNLSDLSNQVKIAAKQVKVASKITKELEQPKPTSCYRRVHLWCNNKGELGFPTGVNLIDCPGSTCGVKLNVNTNIDTIHESEALILYHWSGWDWSIMHKRRPPGQKWVFYTLESPQHTRNHVVPPYNNYNTTYDYIMTFRYDSDFRADYGQYIHGKPELDASDNRNWAENRTKIVAWMASNCHATSWPRTAFVKSLSKYIEVGMYGRCGNLPCPKGGSKICDNILAQYKFYLALENSECTDYITEKFWIQSLVRGLVPIVYGPPRSDYENVAPPNSFIHIQDFKTIRDLAEYLIKVDKDDALYNSYFAWKKVGSLKPYGKGRNIMCQLGDRLEADEKAVADGSYRPSPQKDWKVWWSDSCKRRGKIPE